MATLKPLDAITMILNMLGADSQIHDFVICCAREHTRAVLERHRIFAEEETPVRPPIR